MPLSNEAMAILDRRSNSASKGGEFVFPSNRSASGHITDKSGKGGFWRRITKAAGLYNPDASQNLQVHDLRRTLATYQVTSGGSLQATSKLLGHSSISTTSDVYAHLSVDIVRQELESTTQFMLNNTPSSKLERIKEQVQDLSNEETEQLYEFINSRLAKARSA